MEMRQRHGGVRRAGAGVSPGQRPAGSSTSERKKRTPCTPFRMPPEPGRGPARPESLTRRAAIRSFQPRRLAATRRLGKNASRGTFE